MRPKIYVSGPISKGDLCENVNRATDAFVRLARAGFAPLCPHWSVFSGGCQVGWVAAGDGEVSRQVYAVGTVAGNSHLTHADWLGVDLPWVSVADAVLRLPGESAGADTEAAHAVEWGIPVFDTVEAVVAWGRTVYPFIRERANAVDP